MNWIADQILNWLQKRCQHPGNMVAVDILEGSSTDTTVKYCRRCGAVKINRSEWRKPDPNLWRH